MSKAFTRESDSEPNDDPVPRRRLPAGINNLITAAGAQRYRDELAALLERKQSADSASEESKTTQSRIRQLQAILGSITVATPPLDQTAAGFGATVRVRYTSREEAVFQIVGIDESDPEHDKISWQSPLARELIGRRAGDKFRFRAPAGEQELEILAVSYSVAAPIH